MEKEIKKFKEFKKWFGRYILKNYGEKCSDFVWSCPACHAHFVKDLFNDFVNDLVETEKWSKKQKRKPKIRKGVIVDGE